MSEQYNLKPCPFCGGKARMDADTDTEDNARHWTFGVICADKTCGAKGEYYNNAREAKASWNTRTEASMSEQYETVNHPVHYQNANGIECIDVIENMPFNTASAVKYLWRCGHKPGANDIEDLRKAAFYIQREIERRTRQMEAEKRENEANRIPAPDRTRTGEGVQ